MSLVYRTYWVDDDKDFPNSIVEELEVDFDPETISFKHAIVESGDGLEEAVSSTNLDLIIMDYGLDGRNGDELIRSLRMAGELTEIVFYSQDASIHERCETIEGVHTVERGNAVNEIKKVVERFIDRNNNVAVMRGVIISEAIDVENKLTEIIIELFGEKGEMFRTRVLNVPLMGFANKLDFLQGALKDILKRENEKRAKNVELIEGVKHAKSILNDLLKDVIHPRNILAHSEKTFADGSLILAPLTKGDPIVFNDDWKNDIREKMRKHLSNLANVRKILTVHQVV